MSNTQSQIDVVCIGGAAVDRSYQVKGELVPESSNPSSLSQSFGGVARNVAENLAKLSKQVALISLVGEDPSGAALRSAVDDLGIDVSALTIDPTVATAEYAAILDTTGALHLGLAAMDAFDALTSATVAAGLSGLAPSQWVFADCNLPADSLAYLLANDDIGFLAVNTVSVAKAKRLPVDLSGIELLFANLDEARALVGDGDPEILAQGLIARGAASVVLTAGPDGYWIADDQGTYHQSVAPAHVVDVTGAGDALIAGTLFGLLSGTDLASAVQKGASLAARTLAVRGAVVPSLTPDLLS